MIFVFIFIVALLMLFVFPPIAMFLFGLLFLCLLFRSQLHTVASERTCKGEIMITILLFIIALPIIVPIVFYTIVATFGIILAILKSFANFCKNAAN